MEGEDNVTQDNQTVEPWGLWLTARRQVSHPPFLENNSVKDLVGNWCSFKEC